LSLTLQFFDQLYTSKGKYGVRFKSHNKFPLKIFQGTNSVEIRQVVLEGRFLKMTAKANDTTTRVSVSLYSPLQVVTDTVQEKIYTKYFQSRK